MTTGRVCSGLEGFRQSHHQALRAAASIRGYPAALGALHRYDDVSLVPLIASDEEWGADFLRHELGPLWGDEAYLKDLRETPRASYGQTRNDCSRMLTSQIQRSQRADDGAGAPPMRWETMTIRMSELIATLAQIRHAGGTITRFRPDRELSILTYCSRTS